MIALLAKLRCAVSSAWHIGLLALLSRHSPTSARSIS